MMAMWLAALKDVDPDLAACLEAHAGAEPLTSVDNVADKPVSPDGSARQWLDKQIPLPNVLITGGNSQANLILPLLRLNASLHVLWLDWEVDRLAAGLNALDGTELCENIRSGRLVLDAGEREDPSINRFLGAVDFSRLPRIRLLDAEPVPTEDYEMVIEMTRPARELIRFQSCDLSTRLRFGKIWQSQTIRNIPSIVRQAGIKSLFDVFRDKPAIVIAAGPSLEFTVPYIAANRHKLVVIAVGRVLTNLVHRFGIAPDLVVTGDGQEMVINHFKHKPREIPVAATCFTDPDLIAGLDRIFFMEVESMQLPKWLQKKLGPQGEIFPGGNVATAAMAVADAMGCNPILTAGLDLSYPEDGKTHISGKTLSELAADPEHERFNIYEVEGNYRPRVKTNRQMLHYIDFTRDYVQGHPKTRFVNLNTDGARIEGMILEHPEAIGKYLGGPVNAACRIARHYRNAIGDAAAIHACIESLRADLPTLKALRQECLDAAMLCNQIIMLVRRPGNMVEAEERLQTYLDRLKPLDEKLKHDPVMELLDARLEDASQRLSERMLTDEELAVPPSIRSNLRWRYFYKSVADACRASDAILVRVIDQLSSMITKPDSGCPELKTEGYA
jgi:hypothetical protein